MGGGNEDGGGSMVQADGSASANDWLQTLTANASIQVREEVRIRANILRGVFTVLSTFLHYAVKLNV